MRCCMPDVCVIQAACDSAPLARAGCVWSSIFDAEDAPALVKEAGAKSNPQLIWVLRWLHTSRTVRMGYNVFWCETKHY